MARYNYERRADGGYEVKDFSWRRVGIVRRTPEPKRKEYPWECECVCGKVYADHSSRDRAAFDADINCVHEGE